MIGQYKNKQSISRKIFCLFGLNGSWGSTTSALPGTTTLLGGSSPSFTLSLSEFCLWPCLTIMVKISILTTRSEPLRRPWSRETCPWSALDQCDSPWSPLPVNTWSRSLIRSPISSARSPLYQPHQYVWNLISVVFPVEYCPTNSTEGLPVKSASFNDIIKYTSPGSPSLLCRIFYSFIPPMVDCAMCESHAAPQKVLVSCCNAVGGPPQPTTQ